MSTSLVMMDTGAHRRPTPASNSSSSSQLSSVDAKQSIVPSNLPINFAMKFLANSGHHNSASNTSSLANNNSNNHHPHNFNYRHPNGLNSATAPVSVKLEPRVPSPCTADLAGKLETRVPSPCIKDISVYLANSAAVIGKQLVNESSNRMGTLEGNIGSTFAIKKRSEEGYNFPGQTIILNGSSPPPLMHNGHYFSSQSVPGANSKFASSTTANNNSAHSNSTSSADLLNGIKRNHEDAFGPSSTTSLPSSTNSPSPPPLMSNGYHQSTPTSMLSNGCNIASPTSSSYSDFGSTGKEEMSPSNSVNGYGSIDSLAGDPKKKKGPAPRQQEELCLVCGDRASGYHYNALTCEGCKGFFRRSITKNAVYQCKYGNNCEIDMYMRRKCQECRLKKCLSVGMRPECVVPEYQCAIKREAKRAIKEKDKPNSTTKESLSPGDRTPISMIDEKPPLTPSMSNNWNSNSNDIIEITSKKLTLSPQQEEIIKKLVYYQEEFESPSEDDIKKIAPFPLGENEEDNLKRFQHVTEMTILTVQLIVEFSKRVPFFDTLYREDQITLLKACSSEVMMLRCSRKYDIHTDSIVYANNQPYTRDNYTSASISYTADALFNFCRRMCMLKVDNAEYALLTAIVIFSDRPALIEPHKVEEIQERYIETLRAYVESHRPPNKCHFAKLLGILTELRTLGNINSEMCVSLKVQNKKLPPFLAEIWDIQE